VVERPHVIYNDATKLYVMYMHIDSSNYGEAKVGVATSTSICGAYSYKWEARSDGVFEKSWQFQGIVPAAWISEPWYLAFQGSAPLLYLESAELIQTDTNGTGYLLTEDVGPDGLLVERMANTQ